MEYPSVENAYQAAKVSPQDREFFRGCTSGEAKKYGRRAYLKPDWEDVKNSLKATGGTTISGESVAQKVKTTLASYS